MLKIVEKEEHKNNHARTCQSQLFYFLNKLYLMHRTGKY